MARNRMVLVVLPTGVYVLGNGWVWFRRSITTDLKRGPSHNQHIHHYLSHNKLNINIKSLPTVIFLTLKNIILCNAHEKLRNLSEGEKFTSIGFRFLWKIIFFQ